MERVYCRLADKELLAQRVSNQTLKVKKTKLPDSDRIIVEDKRGHRYARNSISLEGFGDCYIFNMIWGRL